MGPFDDLTMLEAKHPDGITTCGIAREIHVRTTFSLQNDMKRYGYVTFGPIDLQVELPSVITLTATPCY